MAIIRLRYRNLRVMLLITATLFTFAFALRSSAASSGITYHGRLVEPDGVTPVTGPVSFTIEIHTPNSADCLMYGETQNVNLSGTNGIFALTIGDGTRTDSTGLTLDKVFANRGVVMSFDPSTCVSTSTYTPADGDGRVLRVSFTAPSSGVTTPEALPDQTLNYSPLAIEAQQISGFPITSLVRFQKADGTLAPVPLMNDTEAAALKPLLDGTSSLYAQPGNATNGTTIYTTAVPTGITSNNVGDMWLDTSGGVGNDVLKINTDSGVKTIGLSSTGFINAITAGTGITATTASGVATIGIAAGGVGATELAASAVTDAKIAAGTITGDKLDPNIGIATTSSVSAANLSARSIGIFNSLNDSVTLTAPSGAFTNYGLTFPAGQGTAGQVLTLTDATTGQMSWVAPSAGSVTSVTATATAGNPIVVGGTAAAPTIGLPAATSSVNGYLTAADYSSFSSKASGSLATNYIFVGSAGGVATGVPMTGDVSIVSSGLTKVVGIQGVGVGTSAPTSAGEVLRYDGTSTYQPSFLSMADIRSTTMPGLTIFPTTSCSAGQALSWSSLVDQFTCSSIALDGSQITSGTIPAARLPASSNLWALNGVDAYNTNSGKIGIGTTTPVNALDIGTNGGIHITSGAAPTNTTSALYNQSGTLYWNGIALNSGSPGIGGSGTTNYLPIYTAGNTLGQSPVYANGANVGIGTTAPSSPLTVAGVIQSTSGGVKFPDGTTQTTAASGAANTFIQNGNAFGAAAILGTTDNNVVGLITNGTRRVTIDTSGNVGIGTTSPSQPLEVAGNAKVGALIAGKMYPSVDSATGVQFNKANGTTNVMDIDTTNGRVGIGTTAPGYPLDVVGQINSSTGFSIAGVPISAAGSSIWALNATNAYNTNAGNVGIGTDAPASPLSVNGGASFGTYATTAAPLNGLIVSGNVGIGTTSPVTALQVSGGPITVDSASGLRFGTSSYGYISGSSGGGSYLEFGTGGSATPTMYLTSGYVGIGTTAPVDLLSLGTAPTASATHALVNLTNTALVGASASGTYLGVNPASASADLIDYQVAGVTKFLVDKNGKITGDGSGLTGVSASGTLFSGLTAAATTNTIDNTNFAQTWNWSTAAGQTPLSMNANALTTGSVLSISSSNASLNSTNGLLSVANTGASTTGLVAKIQSNSTAGSGLYVLASGNVGVGTTAPASPLTVAGVIQSTSGGVKFPDGTTQTTAASGAANTFIQNGNAFGASAVLGTTDNNVVGIITNGTRRVTIDTSGNVGIGTTAPGYPLHVSGDAFATGHFYAGWGTAGVSAFSTGNGGISSANSGNDLVLSSNAVERMRLNSSGNVGIGTTAPSQALEVAGSAKLSGALIAGKMYPSADAVAGVQFNKANGTTNVMDIDTTNARVGVGTTAPGYPLDVVGQINSSTGFSIAGVPISAAGSSIWALNATNAYNTNAGNVGIGTDAPASPLSVNGGASIGTYATTAAPTNGLIVSGNVGIGTTAPSHILTINQVDGNDAFLSLNNGSSGKGAYFSLTSASNYVSYLLSGSAQGWSFGEFGGNSFAVLDMNTSNSPFIIEPSAPTGSLYLRSTGNVGIGTTAPANALDIGTNGGIHITSGAAPTSTAAALYNNGGTLYWNGTALSSGATGIGGSGTPNYVPLFSGTNTISNSPIYANGLNVGIGTTAPSYTLDVVGGYVRASNFRTAGQYLATSASPAAPSFSSNISGNTGLFFPAVNNIGFAINGTESVHIDSSGNLGIGTTAPANALDIGTGGGIHITSGTPSSTTAALYNNAGTLTWNGVALNSGSPGIGGSGVTNYLPIYTAANTLGSSPVYATGGNVGIGTTAPTQKTEIAGKLKIGDGTNGAIMGLSQFDSGATRFDIAYPANGAIRFGGSTTYSDGAGFQGFGGTDATFPGQMYFDYGSSARTISGRQAVWRNLNNGANTTVMTMDANGNVGIGTTAPAYKLDISGGVRSSTGGFTFPDGTTQTTAAVGAGTTSPWSQSGNNVYPTSMANYVGVGTSAPYFPLHVFGNAMLSTTDFAPYVGSSLLMGPGATSGSVYSRIQVGMGAGSGPLALQPSGGNVGIGTTAPAYKLDVAGAINATSLLINGVAVGAGGSSPWTAYGSNIANNNSGNVGIGTTAPTDKLDVISSATTGNVGTFVASSGTANSALYVENSSSSGYGIFVQNAGKNFINGRLGLGVNAPLSALDVNGGMALGTYAGTAAAPSNALIVSGNVGIGTTAPATMLDVAGDVNIAASNKLLIGGLPAMQTYSGPFFGVSNSFIGTGVAVSALDTTTAFLNTGVGSNAGKSTTTGRSNTMIGSSSGQALTTGGNNTFLGTQAGNAITTDSYNTALGTNSLYSAASSYNVAVGYYALGGTTTGGTNLGIGLAAGANITTGSNNIIIGSVNAPSATASNQLNIGNAIYGNLSNGNVGIGTTAPTSALTVNGAIVSLQNNGAVTGSSPNLASSLAFSSSNTFYVVPSSASANDTLTLTFTGTPGNGANYLISVIDSVPLNVTFAASSCGSFKFKPASSSANTIATTGTGGTLITLTTMYNGSNYTCFVSWGTGYQ